MNHIHIYFRAIFVGCALFMIAASLAKTPWAMEAIAKNISFKPAASAMFN